MSKMLLFMTSSFPPDNAITSKESWELIFTDGVICFEIDVGINGVEYDVIISTNGVPTKKEGGGVISDG